MVTITIGKKPPSKILYISIYKILHRGLGEVNGVTSKHVWHKWIGICLASRWWCRLSKQESENLWLISDERAIRNRSLVMQNVHCGFSWSKLNCWESVQPTFQNLSTHKQIRSADRLFKAETGSCGVPRAPTHFYSWHGGSGAILSVGLLRMLDFDRFRECVLTTYTTGQYCLKSFVNPPYSCKLDYQSLHIIAWRNV